MKKSIVFINQSPNVMLCDIAAAYSGKEYQCTLLSGQHINSDKIFNKVILLSPYNRSSVLQRFYSWCRFYHDAKNWLLNNLQQYDEVFMVSNPPFLFYLPLFNPRLRSKKMKGLVYDLYPDILKSALPNIISTLPSLILSLLNKKSFGYFNKLYTPSFSIKSTLVKYTAQPVETVYNWTDFTSIVPVYKTDNVFLTSHQLTDKFIVLYSGNLGRTHDVKTMLDCAQLTAADTTIIYVFIGHGESINQVLEAVNAGAKNVFVFGWQDENIFPHSIACGDVAWVGYKKGLEEFSIPSKLPYILATGTPVILVGESHSELGRLLVENNIGFCVNNNEPQLLRALIMELANNIPEELKTNCVRVAREKFSVDNAKMFVRDVS